MIDQFFGEPSYVLTNKNIRLKSSRQFVAPDDSPGFVGSLGSCIDYDKLRYLKDKYGQILNPETQKLYNRIKKENKFIRNWNQDTEQRVFIVLNKIVTYLNLNNNIRTKARYNYKKILNQEDKVINNITLIAYCIYKAVKEESSNAPIGIFEISGAFQSFSHRVKPKLILRDGLEYDKYLKNSAIHPISPIKSLE